MKTAMKKTTAAVGLLILGLTVEGFAFAQVGDPPKVPGTGQATGSGQTDAMEGMDHMQMDHSQMDHSGQTQNPTPPPQQSKPATDNMGDMSGMDQNMQMQMDHSGQTNNPRPIPQQGKPATDNMGGMSSMGQNMQMPKDHSQMDHPGHQMQNPTPTPQQGNAATDNMGGMSGMGQSMQMGPMQGGSPPPDARDPGAYAEGAHFADLPGNEMNDEARFGRILFNKFEYAKGDGEHGQSLDGEAWYGNDYDKAWVKAEGERSGGHLKSLRTEALWDHTFATFWSTQLGVRHDSGGGASRNWAAFGVQGLAPYWFETEATAYWSAGTLGARLNARYELYFTQRLILEPEVEANLYSRSDPARGLGSGLSDLQLGLRLRYEIRREFAPYIGVNWQRNFGDTADYAGARGERNKTAQIVAGVRIWY
jgi:copper resistance protein B